MEPTLDITLHILFSLLAGGLVYRYYAKKKHLLLPCFIAAFLAGVAIDIDHFFDYFLAFGPNFSLPAFLNGDQFSVSGKNYVLLHGYEYVLFSLLLFFILKNKRNKTIALTVALSMLFHLLIDSLLFAIPVQQYFLLYRIMHGFVVAKQML